MASALQKVDVRHVSHAGFLHRLAQVRRFGEGPRAVEILRLEHQDDFVGRLGAAQQVLLGQPCVAAFGCVFHAIADSVPR